MAELSERAQESGSVRALHAGVASAPDERASSAPALLSLLGALAISAAIVIRNGSWPGLLIALAQLLFTLGVLRPARLRGPRVAKLLSSIFAPLSIVLLALEAGWLVSALRLYGPHGTFATLSQCGYGFIACAVCGVAAVVEPQARRARLWLGAALILSAILCCAIVLLNPSPPIDVHLFHLQAFEAMRAGRSPYGGSIRNLYPGANFYSLEVLSPDQTRVLIGYPYPPLQVMLAFLAQTLLGDYRLLHALAIPLSAALLALARPGRAATACAALLALLPVAFFVLAGAWIEPVLLLLFSLVVFTALRAPRLMPYALGLFLADKQYAAFLLPLLPLLLPGRSRREQLRAALVAVLVALAVTAPIALWNLRGFLDDVILCQLRQPFRPDSINVAATLVQEAGRLYGQEPWRLTRELTATLAGRLCPGWLCLALFALALGLALWRAPRGPAGFCAGTVLAFSLFFGFAKQSFENYLLFAIGCALWAAALAGEERPSAAPPVPGREAREAVPTMPSGYISN